jgi:DNA-directed RNA polymerase specialized sigma24 family protein
MVFKATAVARCERVRTHSVRECLGAERTRLREVPVSWDTAGTKAALTAMNGKKAVPESLARQLAQLQSRWLSWLRIRHWALKPLHEEIAQSAVADLLEYVSQRSPAVIPAEELKKIGFTILRRRVADQYRSKVSAWADESVLEELPSADPSSDPEEVLTYSRLLRAVLALIAKLDRPARELLLRDESPSLPRGRPLTEVERQRRVRLREELRRQLTETYGVDLKQFLRSN